MYQHEDDYDEEQQEQRVERGPGTFDPSPHFRRADPWIAQLPIDAADNCRVFRLPERPWSPHSPRPERADHGIPTYHWDQWLITKEPAPNGVESLLTIRLVCVRKHVHAVFGALNEYDAKRKIREFEQTVLRLPPHMAIPPLLDEVVGELPGVNTAVLGPIGGLFGHRRPARDQVFRVQHRLRLMLRPGMGGAR